MHDIRNICRSFAVYGDFIIAVPFGTGHINDTYRATFNQAGTLVHYTVQRINHNVFKRPELVMDNIVRVTEHLATKDLDQMHGFSRRTLQLVRSLDGEPFVRDGDGNYWRCYLFVENCRTYDIIETDKQAYEAAKSFGEFQALLADLPGERLHDTIKDFHNTPMRLDNLASSAAADRAGRFHEVQKEYDFIMSRAAECGKLVELQKQGVLPERITHNDTKLNNVLIDDFTGLGLCVIDLDTVMPGLTHYDFGDMVRTGTSPAAEDEVDLSKVCMQFNRFEALLRGFVHGAGPMLTGAELEYLPFSAKLITLEIASRFLCDHLDGDVYFKVHRENHNLDRCRAQLKLVESIESQTDAMEALLHEIISNKNLQELK